MRLPLLCGLLVAVPLTHACCGVGAGGARVVFTGQTNVVVWDKARGIEHFVRDARFETGGTDLGFVVPTPSRPQIVGVDRAAFSLLASMGGAPGGRATFGGGGGAGGGGGGGVTVVERKIVSGYEATVLKADDSGALTGWLSAHGYAVRPYAARWALPYVRRGWYFTAFKVAAGEGAGATGPVRLSFYTGVPFNPYSVPAENRGVGGLSLYYVSATAETARIGGVQPWLSPRWSSFVSEEDAQKLADALRFSPAAIPKRSFVHFYRDESFGRPGLDDLYFVAPPKPYGRDGEVAMALACLGLFTLGRSQRRLG